jgi:hypothetical protein
MRANKARARPRDALRHRGDPGRASSSPGLRALTRRALVSDAPGHRPCSAWTSTLVVAPAWVARGRLSQDRPRTCSQSCSQTQNGHEAQVATRGEPGWRHAVDPCVDPILDRPTQRWGQKSRQALNACWPASSTCTSRHGAGRPGYTTVRAARSTPVRRALPRLGRRARPLYVSAGACPFSHARAPGGLDIALCTSSLEMAVCTYRRALPVRGGFRRAWRLQRRCESRRHGPSGAVCPQTRCIVDAPDCKRIPRRSLVRRFTCRIAVCATQRHVAGHSVKRSGGDRPLGRRGLGAARAATKSSRRRARWSEILREMPARASPRSARVEARRRDIRSHGMQRSVSPRIPGRRRGPAGGRDARGVSSGDGP